MQLSCKQISADWLGGQSAGVQHAKRGWQLHTAAGGPANVPIYASIDDDPSFEQYQAQVAPYLRGWESVVGHQRTGVYGNSKTIEWALHDGLGSYFWQHNWGSPGGRTHPAAHLHQVKIDKRHVGGVGVDINNICQPQFGQWAELYSPVTFPANFCQSADRPVSQQSHCAVLSTMDREVGDDANFQDND
jgi:hypothetical protein